MLTSSTSCASVTHHQHHHDHHAFFARPFLYSPLCLRFLGQLHPHPRWLSSPWIIAKGKPLRLNEPNEENPPNKKKETEKACACPVVSVCACAPVSGRVSRPSFEAFAFFRLYSSLLCDVCSSANPHLIACFHVRVCVCTLCTSCVFF